MCQAQGIFLSVIFVKAAPISGNVAFRTTCSTRLSGFFRWQLKENSIRCLMRATRSNAELFFP